MPLPKIALYQPYPHGLDGLQKVVTSLALSLGEQGFSAMVIVPEPGVYTEEISRKGIPFVVCNPGPSWQVYGRGAQGLTYIFSLRRIWALIVYWFKLAKVLQREEVSILHCNDYRAVLLAAPAGRMLGIPSIWHMHGFLENMSVNLVTSLLVNWTVPVSQGMLDYLKAPVWMLGRIKVIYNGLQQAPSPASYDRSRPIVLAVGNLHPRKGYDHLLRSFSKVLLRVPEAQCWIVGGNFGDGAHAGELKRLAEDLEIESSVRFVGLSDQVSKYMLEARMLVSSSRIEAFGMVAIEAMNLGLPVVATRTGGLKDIVVDRVTGYLVPVGDETALSDHIVGLLLDRRRAEKMGAEGKVRLQQYFTLDRMVQTFSEFYRTLIRAPKANEANRECIT